MQPYMPEETLKRMMLLENQNAELEATADKYKGRWERVEELNRLLVEQSDRRLEILKSLEWVVSGYQFDDDFFCPYCHAKEWTKEHKPDCALAKELSDE